MGEEIEQTTFSDGDREAFRVALRDETKVLKRWFDERRFTSNETPTIGLEIEGWLVDSDCLPAPQADQFIAAANDPRVVPELSKFNFELNADPRPLTDSCFQSLKFDLEQLWQRCERAAEMVNLKPLTIGMLPTVRDEMLQPAWMAESNRYKALNRSLLEARESEPLHISIKGHDRLDYQCEHIMLEAACTSLQSHLQINQNEAVRSYNASLLASAPLVAISANSPFLYGRSLWAETRIPAFEQATRTHGFPDLQGRDVQRVTFGTGYLRHSLLELFLENLSYPTVLPIALNQTETLPHLRLHNGTIWRWNRPILGFNGDDAPHLRIEQRAMPAGPTIVDMVANLAFCFGLTLALATAEDPPENHTTFEEARANFYACAEFGLDAEVCWQGRTIGIQELMLQSHIPQARAALARQGIDESCLEYYFDSILLERVRSAQTGTVWQRKHFENASRNFQALTERYAELQASGAPVHLWPV